VVSSIAVLGNILDPAPHLDSSLISTPLHRPTREAVYAALQVRSAGLPQEKTRTVRALLF
jgi:hypothetical protein